MDFLERLDTNAQKIIDEIEEKYGGSFYDPATNASSGIDATLEAFVELITSHDSWEWMVNEYDNLEWADDVNPRAVKEGRIYAIQMLVLVRRLLSGADGNNS